MLSLTRVQCIVSIIPLLLCSCGGNIKSQINKPISLSGGRTAYIIENQSSYYGQTNYKVKGSVPMVSGGTIVPMPIVVGEDGPVYQDERRGEIDVHIKNALLQRGFSVQIGPEGAVPQSAKVIIRYVDEWKWDLGWFLSYLRISFADPKTGEELAYGLFKSSDFHGLHTPAGEVPRIIDSILGRNF